MKFGSIDNIKKGIYGRIIRYTGIDKRAAESIKQYFSS